MVDERELGARRPFGEWMMRRRSLRVEVEQLEELNLVSDIGFTMIGMGDLHAPDLTATLQVHRGGPGPLYNVAEESARIGGSRNLPESYSHLRVGKAVINTPSAHGRLSFNAWNRDLLAQAGVVGVSIGSSMAASIEAGNSVAMSTRTPAMGSRSQEFSFMSSSAGTMDGPRSALATGQLAADAWGMSSANEDASDTIVRMAAFGGGGGGGPMAPEGRGYVDIVVWPTPAPMENGFEEGYEQSPQNPYGIFINVNWDDDDGDGWTNNALPPNATYTPDKDDQIVTGGDSDLFYTWISVHKGPADPGPWNGTVTVTYGSRIKLYTGVNKSGHIPSGTVISVNDMTQHVNNPLLRYKEVFIEGVSASASLHDTTLSGTYAGAMQMIPSRTTDIVEFSVLEVSINGQFAYGKQSAENGDKFSDFDPAASSDHTGMISWDDYDGDLIPDETNTKDDNGDPVPNDLDVNCMFLRNCVEFTCTIKPSLQLPPPPPGQSNPVLPLTFDVKRDVQSIVRTKMETDIGWGAPIQNKPAWTDDDTTNVDEQLEPNSSDRIFSVDAPGIGIKTINTLNLKELVIYKSNFREYVKVSLYGEPLQQCSDFLKWKAEIFAKEKIVNGARTGFFTRGGGANWNRSATGWLSNISNPDNPD